jgi:hypothetical protein
MSLMMALWHQRTFDYTVWTFSNRTVLRSQTKQAYMSRTCPDVNITCIYMSGSESEKKSVQNIPDQNILLQNRNDLTIITEMNRTKNIASED